MPVSCRKDNMHVWAWDHVLVLHCSFNAVRAKSCKKTWLYSVLGIKVVKAGTMVPSSAPARIQALDLKLCPLVTKDIHEVLTTSKQPFLLMTAVL